MAVNKTLYTIEEEIRKFINSNLQIVKVYRAFEGDIRVVLKYGNLQEQRFRVIFDEEDEIVDLEVM